MILNFIKNNFLTILPIVLSIASLSISLTQFLISYFRARTKYNVELIDYKLYSFEKYDELILRILIENNSSLPVAITKINLIDQYGLKFKCSLNERFVKETFNSFNNEETNKRVYYSAKFPINLTSYGASIPYISFKLPKELLKVENVAYLDVYCNRNIEAKRFFIKLKSNEFLGI